MKRFFFLLLTMLSLTFCAAALADAPASVLSGSELSSLQAKYTDYTIVSAYRCDESNVMVSMHKTQGRNLLVHLQNGSVSYAGTGAVPQGYPVYLGKDTSCADANHRLHFSAIQAINETSGEMNDTSAACHYYADETDFRLALYRVNGSVIRVQQDGLDFDGTTVSGVLETSMAFINVSKLPKTAAQAQKVMSNAPAIPEGTLSADCIDFTAGKTYPVYSAPDTSSLRGANSRAKVSTNDWVQVFGRDGDWLMVQYDITSKHFRIGYISIDALTAKIGVPELNFIGTAAVTAYAVDVTDDPLSSQAKLVSLPAEAKVLCLGTMGSWSYIEGVDGGKTFRGFVPTASLSGSNVVSSLDEARSTLEGAWIVYAGGADRADSLTFSADGSLHGHFRVNGQDGVTTLEFLAGHMDKEDWDGQWSLASYDATQQRYWNDPEFELTITRDGVPQQYGLRICWEPYAANGPGYALILSDSASTSGLVLCK